MKGISLIIGCFSNGVWQYPQIGTAPFGGRNTRAGPQQHEGQRYRGIEFKQLFKRHPKSILLGR